jgi:hypothetical protein
VPDHRRRLLSVLDGKADDQVAGLRAELDAIGRAA